MSEPFHKTRGPKMAGIDLSKAKLAVLRDANRKGFGVELARDGDGNRRLLVVRRDRAGAVTRGLCVEADGTAADLMLPPTQPRMASAAAWRRCLGF